MIGIAIVVVFAFYLSFLWPIFRSRHAETPRSARYDMQMKKLWSAAQTSMRDHKPLRAEKALLTILKFDEKNAAAYNRLGILYAKEQKFDEAIECFEIAQSLDNNPSSLHNVGLIYLETGAYEKAVMAFEQAINLENDIPARFIALAKAHERLGQTKAAIEALENAYALDHSTNTLRQILAIYEMTGDTEALAATTARIEAQMAADAKAKAAKNRTRSTKRTARPTTKMPSARGTKVTRPATHANTVTRTTRITAGTRATATPSRAAKPASVPKPRSTGTRRKQI